MRRVGIAALAALVLLLAGCSDIPTSGPVKIGATEEPNGIQINYIPNRPAPGASPQEIVAGFVAAGSAGGRFTVAKEYLTQAAAAKWRPLAQVLVQGAQPVTTQRGTNEVSLQVPITASVRSDGVYSPRSNPVTLDFQLVQQSGQWRIDRAPDGIVLPPTGFQRLFKPVPLQFFDQTWTRLVPDTRWFPVSTSTDGGSALPNPDSVVEQLIAGPVGPIGGGVTVNALEGATLQGSVETGDNGTTVTLTVPGSPSAEVADRMQQQLIRTLNVPTPGALRLVLNSRVAAPVKALANENPEASAVVVAEGRYGTLSPTGVFAEDTSALGRRIIATKPQAVTVSVKQRIAAVLTSSGEVAAVTASRTQTVDSRPGLLPPTLDQRGWIYSIPADSPDGLQVSNGKGTTAPLAASLPGTQVTSIEVSPDGTRLLVFVSTGDGPEAFVAGIERRADGTPVGLTSTRYPVDLGGNTGSGIGATWVDAGNVAVLVAAPNTPVDRVQLQPLGGIGSALGGSVSPANAIVGTSTQADLRILLTSGDLVVSNDQPWHEEWPSAPSVSVLAVQR